MKKVFYMLVIPAGLIYASHGFAANPTTLKVCNTTQGNVPMMLRLNPQYHVNLSSVPASWGVAAATDTPLFNGHFWLPANQCVSWLPASGTTVSGSISYGATFTGASQGGTACYPQGQNIAEFTLNTPPGIYSQETVEISNINGANAALSFNLATVTSRKWNNGSGGNKNVTTFANPDIDNAAWSAFVGLNGTGVLGFQATGCTTSSNPPDGPGTSIPGPIYTPQPTVQLQSIAQCMVQRSPPYGGTVTITYNGVLPDTQNAGASYTASCVGTWAISPGTGPVAGNTSVTLAGAVSNVTGVSVQGSPATNFQNNGTSLTFTTPPSSWGGAGAAAIVLTTTGGTSYTVPANIAGNGGAGAFVYQ